jgi:hypothetical protein
VRPWGGLFSSSLIAHGPVTLEKYELIKSLTIPLSFKVFIPAITHKSTQRNWLKMNKKEKDVFARVNLGSAVCSEYQPHRT